MAIFLKFSFKNASLFQNAKSSGNGTLFLDKNGEHYTDNLNVRWIGGGKNKTKKIVRESETITGDKGCNTDYIIGVNQLSNALHVMFGYRPVPSKRDTPFEINNKIFNLAENAYIKYNNKFHLNKRNILVGGEMTQTAKHLPNSHKKITTILSKGGEDTVINGYWNWEYVKNYLNDDVKWLEFEKFLSEFVGIENISSKKTFYDVMKYVDEQIHDPRIEEFIQSEVFKGRKPLKELFTTYGTKGNVYGGNTGYKTETPMFNNNGIAENKISFSGDIIIKLDEESDKELIERFMSESEYVCTILDGGLFYLSDKPTQTISLDGYTKLTEYVIPKENEDGTIS